MDQEVLSAAEAVRRYVAAVREIRGMFFAGCPGVDHLGDFLTAVRSTKAMGREGRSSTGITYSVHGAGCRMIDQRGREIDIDWIDGNVEAFDPYRIRWFLYADEDGPLSLDDLFVACLDLVERGELRQAGEDRRWFALPAGS